MSNNEQDKLQDEDGNDPFEAKDVANSSHSPLSIAPQMPILSGTPPSLTPPPPSSPKQEIDTQCSSISLFSYPSYMDSMNFRSMQSTPQAPPRRSHYRSCCMIHRTPFYHNPNLMMAVNFPFAPYLPYDQPLQPHAYQMRPGFNAQLIAQRERSWSSGPFDCFSDIKNSFITLFCACLTFGQIAEIINEGQTPWWENALLYAVLEGTTAGVAAGLYGALYRVKMRDRYSLKGTLLWDVFFTIFCTRLSLCQQYRQLHHLGFLVPLGWQANREKHRRIILESMCVHHQFVPPVVEPGMYR